MIENIKNLSLFCAALGIPHENLPNSELLAALIIAIRRDFEYQGLGVVEQKQIKLLSEACGYLVPIIDDEDIFSVFKGLNAFDINTTDNEARVSICRKLDSIEISSDGYCEGYAYLMLESLQRGLKTRSAFGVNEVLIYLKLDQLAFMRGVHPFDGISFG